MTVIDENNGTRLGWLRAMRLAAVAGVAAVLVACGGDSDCTAPPAFEGEQVGKCDDGSSSPRAADLTLTLSATTLSNDGSSTIVATATAVDRNRNTLAEIPVTISPNNNASATASGAVTDEKGVVTAEIGIGADRSNRSITVTATSSGLTRTATFQVIGANLTASAVPGVAVPGSTGNKIDFRLVDVNSNPMSGQSIVVNGVGGVEIDGTTDSNGSYIYTYTAPGTAGSLDIRATAGGVSKTVTVLVQSGTGSIPAAAIAVQSATLAASPSVVPVNTDSTNNRANLRVLFLGTGNKPVPNVRVRFDLNGDANSVGGSLSAGSNVVYTDANGVATTAYVPGSRFSPTDGLTVRACWSEDDFPAKAASDPDPVVGSPECPNAALATLTVISEALSVSISTNALIEVGPTGLDYIKKYLVQVNDSSGNAMAGVQISPSIDLLRYFKGAWVVEGDKWAQRIPYDPATADGQGVGNGSCDNEDVNRNGVLQVYSNGDAEDANGTGALEPRKADVNISFVGSSTTNSDGQVVLKITYGQSLASWIEFNILVAASGVAGTEGRTNYRGVLPVLADAVSDADNPPAFVRAPYGVLASPTVPMTNPVDTAQTDLLFLCTNPN